MMRPLPIFGLRFRIVVTLAAVLAGFILLTELSVSRLTRATLSQVTVVGETSSPPFPHRDGAALETKLLGLRRLVFFYLVLGAVAALLLGAYTVNRLVVTPINKVNEALRLVAEGKLDTTAPSSGSREIAELGQAFNRMTLEIKRQRDELEERLAQLERSRKELEETQDSLVRAAKLASVGTLAAGVAHEIGNPLAGMLGLAEALEPEGNPAVRGRYLKLIKTEIARIDRIIRDLLSYARPEKEDATGSANIRTIIEQLRSLLSAQKLFDGVTLELEIPDGLAEVTLAPDSLTQVLLNVLLNAAQAMEGKGEVFLSAKPLPRWCPPMGTRSGPAVRIDVRDTGPGVSGEDAARIFDPFYSNRRSGKGSGLGLAISQSICDRAGGEITLNRDVERGAWFQITLPAAGVRKSAKEGTPS